MRHESTNNLFFGTFEIDCQGSFVALQILILCPWTIQGTGRFFLLVTTVATQGINFGILIKNTPESRTRLALDITATIETNFGVHLPLPCFTF